MSATPAPNILENYRGEWVAMVDGQIVDHDIDLYALGLRLREGRVKNDRLFRVPDDPTEPLPATLG